MRPVPTSNRLSLALAVLMAGLAACTTTSHEASGAPEAADAYASPAITPPPPPSPSLSRSRREAAYSAAPALQSITVTGSRSGLPMPPHANTENYATFHDNPVHRTSDAPVSTFSVDVDTGSYTNVRRMLQQGVRPPKDAVRAEEFINYFDYGHAAPADRATPFRVTTELATGPWNAERHLLMIGIQGYDVPKSSLPPSNLVFLIDTSGSMNSPDKLPLVKTALRQLVPQLRAQDRVSIVVYAGSAGLVLPPTPGDRHRTILDALDQLEAGGSTNGGEGIRLAYAMAREARVDGVNRVILATDGDFNVGVTDPEALKTLVADQRKSGIALSTLGFGSGNYNDAMAEQLADVGDGNHAYIDSEREARRVLADEMQATLLTIARDVKIQLEFNPAQVAEYRLIGYENRVLRNEDFANDRVDAGDIGAGHSVTALYELVPVGSATQLPALRYGGKAAPAGTSNEIAHLRLRYKPPQGDASRLIDTPITAAQRRRQPSDAMQLAAAVAAFADALRGGQRMGMGWGDIARLAGSSDLPDRQGAIAELRELIGRAERLTGGDAPASGPPVAE